MNPAAIDRLPDNVLYNIYSRLNKQELAEVAGTSRRHHRLAKAVFHDTVERLLPPLYEALPSQVTTLLPQQSLHIFVKNQDPMVLVRFMINQYGLRSERPGLRFNQLNELALTCFHILHQIEHPYSPNGNIPVFTSSQVFWFDVNGAYEDTPLLSVLLLGAIASATCLYFEGLALFSKTHPFGIPRYDLHMGSCIGLALAMVVAFVSVIMSLVKQTVKLQWKKSLYEFRAGSHSEIQYKEWLKFIQADLLKKEGDVFNYPNMKYRYYRQLFNNTLENASGVLLIIPYLYLTLFLIGSILLPTLILMANLSVYQAKAANTLPEDLISLKINSAINLSLCLGTFGAIVYSVYTNETVRQTIDDHVYTDHEFIKICTASLAFCLAIASISGLVSVAKHVAPIIKECINSSGESIGHTLCTTRVWLPFSRARRVQEHAMNNIDVEAGPNPCGIP